MRDLQLGALIADDSLVFRPVELEGFSGLESQRRERAMPCHLEFPLPVCLPVLCEGCNTALGVVIAEVHRVAMKLLQGALLRAPLSWTPSSAKPIVTYKTGQACSVAPKP